MSADESDVLDGLRGLLKPPAIVNEGGADETDAAYCGRVVRQLLGAFTSAQQKIQVQLVEKSRRFESLYRRNEMLEANKWQFDRILEWKKAFDDASRREQTLRDSTTHTTSPVGSRRPGTEPTPSVICESSETPSLKRLSNGYLHLMKTCLANLEATLSEIERLKDINDVVTANCPNDYWALLLLTIPLETEDIKRAKNKELAEKKERAKIMAKILNRTNTEWLNDMDGTLLSQIMTLANALMKTNRAPTENVMRLEEYREIGKDVLRIWKGKEAKKSISWFAKTMNTLNTPADGDNDSNEWITTKDIETAFRLRDQPDQNPFDGTLALRARHIFHILGKKTGQDYREGFHTVEGIKFVCQMVDSIWTELSFSKV